MTASNPDFIVTAKTLSKIGAGVVIIIYNEKLDVWAPGRHTGALGGTSPLPSAWRLCASSAETTY